MNRWMKYLLWGFIALLAVDATAAEPAREPGSDSAPNAVLLFGMVEGVFAFNAALATIDPQVYGGLGLLLFPLGVANGADDTTFWAGLAATEALAVYNLTLDKDEYSSAEIFRNNMVAWHLVAGIIGVTYLLSDADKNKPDRLAIGIMPLGDGAGLRLHYRL